MMTAYVDALGFLLEAASGGSTPSVIYSVTATLTETHESTAVSRFDDSTVPGTQGWMAGVLEAIGEADNQIGGFRMTRLMDPVDVGEDVFPVENAQDWEASGRVAIDGVVYTYDSRSAGRLSGITHVFHGDVIRGARKLHYRDSPVLDLGNPFNAIQKLRRAFLIDTAEGDDLNALGRNLGVLRYAYLASDETYRAIVKSMAYNPRGTLYGLRLVLDAMLGAGQYDLFEDLVRHPCTVFIRLATALGLTAMGHAYAQARENPQAEVVSGHLNSIPLVALPVTRGSVSNVLWHDMDFLTAFSGSIRPSVATIVDYAGDTGTTPWQFDGVSENTQVTPGPTYVRIENPAIGDQAFYALGWRSEPNLVDSGYTTSMLFSLPTGYTQDPANYGQWGMRVWDFGRLVCWGVRWDAGQSKWELGFCDKDGVTLGGRTVRIAPDTWHEVQVEKRSLNGFQGLDAVTGGDYPRFELALLVDGIEVDVINWWDVPSFPNSDDPFVAFGSFTVDTGHEVRGQVKHVGVQTHCPFDFSQYIDWGDVDAGTNRLHGSGFVGEDVGKRVQTFWTYNMSKHNEGIWNIHSRISGTEVELWGDSGTDASVETAYPKRISIPFAPEAFQYPNDIGRKIVLSGSTKGNNGAYTISKLFRTEDEVDLASLFQTPGVFEKTNLCEITAASFVSEAGLDWHLEPNFDAETGLGFVLSSAEDVGLVGGDPYVTLRDDLYSGAAINAAVDVLYSRVLTAEILEDSNPILSVLSTIPLKYSHYPFYITDPLGFIKAYLQGLTAAGVILEYLTEE